MKTKKMVPLILSLAMAAASVQMPAYAEGEAEEEMRGYCVATLKGKPVASYDGAKELGVNGFILTEAGRSAYEAVKKEQAEAKAKIDKHFGREVDEIYSYTAAANALCIELSESEYKDLKDNCEEFGIKYVFIAKVLDDGEESGNKPGKKANGKSGDYSAMTEQILDKIGAGGEYRGEGMVIGIIDNEFDLEHEYFTLPEGTQARLGKDDIKAVKKYLCSTNYSKSYKGYVSEKIPYAFDYENKNSDASYLIEKSEDETAEVRDDSHGTHVAGIAAGNGDGVKNAKDYAPSGVVPEAQLLLMQTQELEDQAIYAAFDDLLYLGADVINCSFGLDGAPSDSWDESLRFERELYGRISNSGVIVCVSSGNSGKYDTKNMAKYMPDTATSGTPSGYKSTLTVASANNYYTTNEAISYEGGSINYIASTMCSFEKLMGKTKELVVVGGTGTEEDFNAAPDVKGKVVLVSRGNLFTDTEASAKKRGASAVLVYNYIDNNESVNAVTNGKLPFAFISYADGMRLMSAKSNKITFKKAILSMISDGGTVSNFSAWGPSADLGLCVDLAGFGGKIYSSVYDTKEDNAYDIFDGTSMSSPQMTGMAAAVKQYVKQNADKFGIVNNSDYSTVVKRLLMSTATPICYDNLNVTASPRVQGSGLASIKSAIDTPAYIYTDGQKDYGMPKASLGDDPEKTGDYKFSFFVKNISESEVSYDLSCEILGEYYYGMNDRVLDGAVVAFTDANGAAVSGVTVPAGSEKQVNVQIKLSDRDKQYMNENYVNGTFVEGYVRLQNAENPGLTIPYMAFYGDWAYDDFIIDPFIYSGETPAISYSYVTDNNGIQLGYNDFADYDPYYAGNPVYPIVGISPNGDMSGDEALANLLGTRAAEKASIVIYNEKGNKVFTDKFDYILPTSAATPETTFYTSGNEGGWDGKDADGKVHNGAFYTMVCTAKKVYEGRTGTDTIGCNIVIDLEAPEILSSEVITEGEAEYLHVTASDNWFVKGAAVFTNQKCDELMAVSAVDSQPGAPADIYVDITGYEGNVVFFEVDDFAGNCTMGKVRVG